MSETRCPSCKQPVDPIGIDEIPLEIWTMYPADAIDAVPNARTFRQGRVAFLHHACPSAQSDTDTRWWDFDRSWWACADPTRPLDENIRFDLNCMDCAERWSSEGAELLDGGGD